MRVAISTVIVGVLALQGFWVVPDYVRRRVLQRVGGPRLVEILRAPASYPFVDYPMYRQAHRPGEEISHLDLFVRRSDGSEQQLRADGVGMTYWHFNYLLEAIFEHDVAAVRTCLAVMDPDAARGIEALRIENQPLVWDDGSVHDGERRVMMTLALDGADLAP